jgi:hypothetical protein
MGAGNFRGDPLFAGPLTSRPLSSQPSRPADFAAYYQSLTAPFRLQASSPAIDAAGDIGLPFMGAAPDFGAFEY